MNEIKEDLKFIVQNYKNFIDIINETKSSFVNDELNLLEIQNFFKKLGVFSANEFFGEQKLMLNAKISQDFIVKSQNRCRNFNENLSKLCDAISEDQTKFYELVIFLSQWINDEFLPNYENLILQINLINNGISPQKAYEKIKQNRSKNVLTESVNSLINAILTKNCEITNLNKQLCENIKSLEKQLENSNKKDKQIDEISGLPHENIAIENIELFLKNKKQIGLVIIKFLNLNKINDNCSTDFVYEIIQKSAHEIKKMINKNDLLCKTMFNEFILVSHNPQISSLINMANKIQKSISNKNFKFRNKNFNVNVNLAITISNHSTKNSNDLIQECKKKFENKKLKNNTIKI